MAEIIGSTIGKAEREQNVNATNRARIAQKKAIPQSAWGGWPRSGRGLDAETVVMIWVEADLSHPRLSPHPVIRRVR